MVFALSYDHSVILFADHIPRLSRAAQTQAFALTDRVKTDAIMRANVPSLWSDKRPRLICDVFLQKLFKRALADKADAGAVFFASDGQVVLLSEFSDFALLQMPNRKENFRQFFLLQRVEEIALVFAGVCAP